MGSLAPRKCRNPRCSKLTREGYCEDHKSDGWNKGKSGYLTPAQRGYDEAWRRLRQRILKRDKYLCQICESAQANEVDHKIEKEDGGTDDPENLQSVCTTCHRKKTAASRIARAVG